MTSIEPLLFMLYPRKFADWKAWIKYMWGGGKEDTERLESQWKQLGRGLLHETPPCGFPQLFAKCFQERR